MKRISTLIAALSLAGCAGTATAYPLNQAAVEAGSPKLHYVNYGTGHGPVTVTMPDGEVLKGEYRVISNVGFGYGFSGATTATAITVGGGSPVVVSAVDKRGTIMNCRGAVGLDDHGALDCQTNNGARWRMMF